MMTRLAHRLLRVRSETVAVVFLFWAAQVLAWPLVMLTAIFDPKPFVNSLLFTVEISLWALELAAGIGVTGAWAVLHAKQTGARLADMHADVQVVQEMEAEEKDESDGMETRGSWVG